MNSSETDFIKPTAVRFDATSFWIDVEDGRTLGVPIAWFPRLLRATHEQRLNFELSALGIHWEALDEDIHVGALFAGFGDRTKSRAMVAG
jgi:Protein of unknown function (DUF2442)